MTTTPADGTEPTRPQDGTLAPTAPGTHHDGSTPRLTLTRPQKILIGFVIFGAVAIAAIGFIGSYTAVTQLAYAKGFGAFSRVFTLGIDLGIGVFLALDLLLTWLRMPYPALRYGAWLLTAATIAFNAVVSWPDPVGVGMHAVIPILFVVSVEAARHAVGRIAEITADKHIEGPNVSRWLLNPIATFILWRRQRLWGIRKWDTVLTLEQERRIYCGKLRREHGRLWRWKATAQQALVLRLARNGMSVTEAVELPAREEAKRREEEARRALEEQRAADARRREQQEYEQEQQRLEEERARRAEADRLERERKTLELEQERREAERQQRIADAEAQARLEEIARQQAEAAAEAERRTLQAQLDHAKAVAAEQERAAEAARRLRENEEAAARAAAEKEAASRRAAEIVRRAASATATPAPASRPASASRPVASQPANAATTPAANTHGGTASPAPATSATETAATPETASATASHGAATTASSVDIAEVVDVYQLLKEQLGKAPSDQKLGDALGVSRSRAQQLRTLAVEAGHTQLAKPVRLAS